MGCTPGAGSYVWTVCCFLRPRGFSAEIAELRFLRVKVSLGGGLKQEFEMEKRVHSHWCCLGSVQSTKRLCPIPVGHIIAVQGPGHAWVSN